MNNNAGYKTISFHMVHKQLDPRNWNDYLTPEEFEQLKQSKTKTSPKLPKNQESQQIPDPPKVPQSQLSKSSEVTKQPQLPQQNAPTEIKPYIPNEKKILSPGNLIHNNLFNEDLSNWSKIEKNKGEVEIIDTPECVLIGEKALKLFLPKHAYSALGGINQEVTLAPDTYYFIEINARTTPQTLAPTLYVYICNLHFKLHCQPHYTFYRILFNSGSTTQTKLQIDTGYKFCTHSSTYFIDNIILYAK